MDRLSEDDAALFAAARVSRDLVRLPGAPGPDWCARAAAALADAAPGSVAWVGVVRPGRAGGRATVERSGHADPWGDDSARDGGASAIRALARALLSAPAAPAPGVHSLGDLAADGLIAPRRLARHERLVVGVVPLGAPDGNAPPVLLAFWGPRDQGPLGLMQSDLRRVLRSALPVLGERLRLALGTGAGRHSSWLSEREQRVLEMLTSGLSVPEVAALIGRSQHTVHDYVKSLHRKLGTSSRGALIARALGHQGPPAHQLGRRPRRSAPGAMLAFRTDGRTAFVDHSLC